MQLCRIRFDGNHHLAMPYKNISAQKLKGYIDTESIIKLPKAYLGLTDEQEKKDLFISEWAEKHFPNRRKAGEEKKKNTYFDELNESLKYLWYKSLDVTKDIKEHTELLIELICNSDELYISYKLYDENEKELIVNYITQYVKNQYENLKARKKTFKRKALNNDWNYFATFTYDDKLHTEETFVPTLKKKLQNLHTRYGWLYMGCFERSEKDRLHFHGLLYVPLGKMRGNIRETEYWNKKTKRKGLAYINDDFENSIGRNDFKPITKQDITFTHSLDYILKYIGKSEERIIYSRGIKDEEYALLDYENNTICQVTENSPYSVLGEEKYIPLTKELYKLPTEN